MHRNSEHYSDPTAGNALAHVVADERRKKRTTQHAQQVPNHKRQPARVKYQYVHAWDSPKIQETRKHAV